MRFDDRRDAGRQLATHVAAARPADPLVLGLPRGGVPVAAEVAAALDAPLDVFVVRKVGAPGHRELGIGAVAEGTDDLVVSDTAATVGATRDEVTELAAAERVELERQCQRYRGDRQLPDVTRHDVVLVDDGLATGVTAEAALRALRTRGARRLLLGAPVCAQETADRLTALADQVVCVLSRVDFLSVGAWYQDFRQVDDAEVLAALGR
ncbi:MAG: phosphoribosyltransferase [Streptosporangiales bacterium]|nr:phosphoribosyltransferase [Streptosporangiales bacterium]